MDENWIVYTDYWRVSTNINTDEMNHLCFVEHRDERGRIRNTIMGKLNLENNIKVFKLDYLT